MLIISSYLNKKFLLIFFTLVTYTSSNIKIISPKELANKYPNNTIETALCSFGTIPYGHKIIGKLYYNTKNKEQSFGCNPITLEIPKTPKVDESPFIMVDAGNCSYTTKVKNIENSLAHVAIIANNEDIEDIKNKIIDEDAKGLNIKIPSVLIGNKDAKILKDYMNKYPNVEIKLELSFEIEKADNTVDYDLWYTPDQKQVYLLLTELYQYHMHMKDSSKLNIHFVTFMDDSYEKDKQQKIPNCIGAGKYCIRTQKEKSNAVDILIEMIRQKCVHNVTYAKGQSDLFWRYMNNFYQICYSENNFTDACSLEAMEISKIETSDVFICYLNSFIGKKNIKEFDIILENKILNNDIEERKNYYFVRVPSLYINKRIFLGDLRAENVFEALCAGLKKKPKICYIEGGFEKARRMTTFLIVYIIILVVLVNIVIFFSCAINIKKKIMERLNEGNINKKIDSAVGVYLQMRETNMPTTITSN